MTEPSRAVFLSYASEDAEAAQRIAEALRGAGIEVWFDKSELRGGDAWDRQIREQIHHCRLFIPVISANSERRDEGYFRREWSLAADRTRDMAHKRAFLVPIVIDETPERGASVPEKFHELQWTRLPGGETPPTFVERVRRLLSPETPSGRAAPSTAPASFRTSETSRRPLPPPWGSKPALWATGVVIAVALSYFVVDRFWPSKRIATPVASAAHVSATALEKSIAVLPFVDLSEKHDQEYFAEGIADELLDMLTQVPGLRVIGRTSSFQFKGKNEDLRTVGRTLGVSHVVEGSVRRYGDQVRITAQLVRSGDGSHEWSGTYDRNVQNVLQVQGEIAASLARALEISFSPTTVAASAGTTSSEAYDLFLRGRHAEDPETREALTDAEAFYRRALEIDPNFIAAQEGLVLVHLIQAANSFAAGDSGYPRVKDEATKLLAHNPHSRFGHATMCRYHLAYSWNWTEAERECDVALRIDARDPTSLYQSAELALALGHPAEAERRFRDILSVDPLDSDVLVELSGALLSQGRFTEAELVARKALAANPLMNWAHYALGASLLAQERLQDALEAFQGESSGAGRQVGLVMAYHALGRNSDAARTLKRLSGNNETGNPYVRLAEANAYVGDSGRALGWLETAHTERDPDLQYVYSDWFLKPLHSDPRFKALLRKMNLPE